ncbi:MAG: M20/M25/M40 family metallo-hydrolase [Bryobacteraceae bacterium]
MKHLLLFLSCTLLAGTSWADDSLLQKPDVKQALAWIESNHAANIEKQIQLSEIPSPTFAETERAAALVKEFQRIGLKDIEADARKNVMGWRPGKSPRAIVVSAHLDTVFPAGTDVHVKKEGKRLVGPGIGDDGRGLAAMLAIAEAIQRADIKTNHSILFVANCCEEGLGDLLGVKYLLKEGKYKDRIDAFISIDGTDTSRIVNRALASKRYKITVRGPGGHSWGNFGRVSPIHALGRIMDKFADTDVPAKPKTTFNIGKIGGGTSINAIAVEAWMEVDMRSESDTELEKLEQRLLAVARAGVDEEQKFRAKALQNKSKRSGDAKLTLEAKLLATRYGGETPVDSPLVQAAVWATKHFGQTPQLEIASTDANVPINLHKQGVTLGGGGVGGDAHALEEWYEPEGAWRGAQQVLLTVLSWDIRQK